MEQRMEAGSLCLWMDKRVQAVVYGLGVKGMKPESGGCCLGFGFRERKLKAITRFRNLGFGVPGIGV